MYSYILFLAFALSSTLRAKTVEQPEWSLEMYYQLRADATCCPQHGDKASCDDEGGSSCIWFNDPNEPIPASVGSQCVGRSYAKCKRDNGITACCAPGCPGGGPPKPTQPGGGPGGIPTPPVCGPTSGGLTPAPTTKAPTTKSPTTQSPTTKAPTTKSPTTKSPTTKAPTTKAPTTKAPTTKSPTTKSPTTKAPTTKAPTTKSPTTKAPTTKAPTTKAPTTKAPTTKSPTTKAPTTKSPTTKAPTTKAPTTKSPTTKAPTTKAPTTKAPTTKAPTTKAPTTLAPTAPTTPAPTRETCQLGLNYNFEGIPCRISGDPHTLMPNGDKHDFQGQPSTGRNQFYYMHPCDGYDNIDMPFNIMVTHYRWAHRSVSGSDYITFELYDGNGDEYLLFLSSALHSYGQNIGGALDTEYDNNAGSLISLSSGSETAIGADFKATYTQIDGRQIKFELKVDNQIAMQIYMRGQTYVVGGRYRMHYIQLRLASKYKCYSCGLCGNFRDYNTGTLVQELETCNGDYINYRPGWKAHSTPEAYDLYGWTWEVGFVKNQCGAYYDVTDNQGNNFVYTDPCDAAIEQQVSDACDAAMAAAVTCCNQIGGDFCAELLTDCKLDACAEADGDVTAIDDAVQNAFTDVVNGVCQHGGNFNGGAPQATIVNVACTTVRGGAAIYPSISSASCPSGYTLTSCNVDAVHPHQIYGNWIEGDVCKTTGGTNTYARARCCQFPSGTTTDYVTTSGDGDAVSVCNADTTLTGCVVNVNQNFQNYHLRIGAAGDDPTGTGFNDVSGITEEALSPTDNTCTAGGFEFNTGKDYVDANAQCIDLPNGYILNCFSKWRQQKSGGNKNWMKCDDGYFMTSCTVRANAAFVPDFWYPNDNNECATQMDNHGSQYAQSICCQLIQPPGGVVINNRNNNNKRKVLPSIPIIKETKISSPTLVESIISATTSLYGIISMAVIVIFIGYILYKKYRVNDKKYDEYSPLINSAYDDEQSYI